jgi:hypothetical protein
MSLVLNAGDRRLSLSYCELHELRGELIRATILALDAVHAPLCHPGPENSHVVPSRFDQVRRELLLALDAEPGAVEWMLAADRPAPAPNYAMLPLEIPAGGLPEAVLNALAGLNWFVVHSDCDGLHSAGQVDDIRDWLCLIAGHVRNVWRRRFRELERLYAQRRVVLFLG